MPCTLSDAYDLFHRGSLALARVEANGICVDVDYLDRATRETQAKIAETKDQLKRDPVWAVWQDAYPPGGSNPANLGSRAQLGEVLFNKLRYPCLAKTATGRPSTDEGHLLTVDLDFVRKYLALAELEKAHGTYLTGIKRETTDDGFLHPVYNLASGHGKDEERGGARSYRGSAALPNFQNMPIRSKVQGELIRRCFIPRPGNVLLEVDYAALEAKICACHWPDPSLIDYINHKDIHKDTAAHLYLLDLEGADKKSYKDARYCSKNKFVFPQFYGSDYIKCAPSLWAGIDEMKLTTPDGVPMKEHLASRGITSLGVCDRDRRPKPGTFEHHVKSFQDRYWGEWFPLCARKRDEWVSAYKKTGRIVYPTGFVAEGVYTRNEVYNLSVQGSGFHCLLWSLIRLQEYLTKHKMKSLIVGQIHDCLIIDCPRTEAMDLLPVIRKIMTKAIRKAWDWIIVELDCEADIVDEGASWNDKKPIKI